MHAKRKEDLFQFTLRGLTMKHKPALRRKCRASDLFITSGCILECGNCGAREDDKEDESNAEEII